MSALLWPCVALVVTVALLVGIVWLAHRSHP